MSNTIKLKRGSGSDPSASDLVVGEVAVRTDSGKLFTKKDDNSVTEIGGGSGAIDDNAITTAKIADDAVTSAKIAANAVTDSELQNGSVIAAIIANNAVVTAKIQDDAVTSAKIATDAVDSTALGPNAVTSAHIAANTITADDIATDAIGSAELAADAVTGDHIANDSIDSEHYVDGSIDTAFIADDAVTYAKIQNVDAGRILGRPSGAGTGGLNSLTASQVRTIINVADGATNVTNNNQLTNGAGYSTFSGSYNDLSNKPSLFSGSYNDLSNKPTIPTNNNQLSNGAGYITSADGGNAGTLDGIDSSEFLRSNTGDTASGDITFTGGAGAVTIGGNSDIRFTNGNWTGESCKIQQHGNSLYMQGGSSSGYSIIFRSGSGSDRWYMSNNGAFYPAADNAHEIGSSSNRVQNLFISGGIYLGGTSSNNYLDDFEEGDWTPSLRGGSNGAGGYSIRDGSYVKIGRLVHVNFGLAITSKGNMNGDLNVGELPFTVQHIINDTSIEASGICGYWKHVSPNSSHLTLVAEQDSNIFVRHTVGAEDDPDQMTHSDIDSDFTIRGSITYYTSQN